MKLKTIAAAFNIPLDNDLETTGLVIDSRQVQPGQVFVAIKGDQFDGHNFIHEVEAKGAVAVVVSRRTEGVQIPQLVVEDTIEALAKIARAHRTTIHCPVIALTGSNGKTSVKEMIASILPQPSLATKGNYNNHIGAPLTAMQLKPEHRYAVFELGANHIGEIAHTVAVVKPDVALINNIAPAHIGEFGSIEGVARAKGEIYQGLPEGGVAVVNDDDAYHHFWDGHFSGKRVIRYSLSHAADVHAENLTYDSENRASFTLRLPDARLAIKLRVPGEHNVRNALAAASCCYAAGIDAKSIETGLNQFIGVKGRLTYLTGKSDSVIIDDTYNANLRSVLAALEVLSKRAGKKVFVFGDMGELGDWAVEHHREVGEAARKLGIDRVICCGTLSTHTAAAFGEHGQHVASQDDAVHEVLSELGPETTVLVKGSRSSAMEKIVHKLLN